MLGIYQGLAQSNTKTWLWPISGKGVGDDILHRPQDYIDGEHNFDGLFIGAKLGAQVIAPETGIVSAISLNYYETLRSSIGGMIESDFASGVKGMKQALGNSLPSELYLSASIGIKLPDGRTIYITGIEPTHLYKTGERIIRGEVIGTVRHSYRKIHSPSIWVSVSNAKGQSADPMTGFGLRTTFKAPNIIPPKKVLTRKEAEEDYRQLTEAIEELYPTLEERMSLEDYRTFVESEIARLPQKMSDKDFVRALVRFNRKVHDSHLEVVDHFTFFTGDELAIPEVFPVKLGSEVVVAYTTPKYSQHIGKRITHINGRSIKDIIQEEYDEFKYEYDADVRSVKEQRLALSYLFTAGIRRSYKSPKDAMRLTLEDGTQLTAQRREQKELIPQFGDAFKGYISLRRGNQYAEGYTTREIDDTTAYLGLSTFTPNEVAQDSILGFVRKMRDIKKPALIIDLRNNYGGSVAFLERLKALLLSPKREELGSYSKVNVQSIKRETLNLVPGEVMFADHKKVEGKKGFYKYGNEAEPPTAQTAEVEAPYGGRLYVLTNASSFSASTDLAGALKRRHKQCTIIGRETGSAYHSFTAVKSATIQLKHTRLKAIIPLVYCVFDATDNPRFPKGRGVIPDIEVPISLEEMRSTEDYLLGLTLQRIATDLDKQ